MHLLLLLLLVFDAQGNTVSPPAKELKKKLLEDYDTSILPSEQMKVEINKFSVQDFKMNDAEHTVEIKAFLSMSWVDPGLSWTPSEHSGINDLGFSAWTIWSPDISLKESPKRWTRFLWAFEPSRVTSDGKVDFMPFYHLLFTCAFDMTYWPHDTHNCSLTIKSWYHGSENLDFDLKVTPTIDLEKMASSSGNYLKEWDASDLSFTKTKSTDPCCPDPFTELRFSVIFTRRAPAYTWTAKVPAVCLCFLTMVVFMLPPDAGEKFTFGGLNLVFNAIFLANTVQIISASPSYTPLLVLMTAQQLLLSSVSMIIASGIFRIAKSPHSSGIPLFLKGPVLGLSRLVMLGNYADLVSSSHKSFTWTLQGDQVELADDSPAAIRERERFEWVLLGALVDRVLLLLYLGICLITLVRFSSVL